MVGMVRRRVKMAQLESEPYLIWNAFVDLLATEDYGDLSPLQRKAYLVFWYESEVQNGGHGQYFENRGLERLAETCMALTELGLPDHARLLSFALEVVSAYEARLPWEKMFQDGAIERLDDEFHKCRPTIMEALEGHLVANAAEYVEEA